MSKDFAGLTAIVTGAGSGIGLEVARKLNDRKSTRLNSSHIKISDAVFGLKKKKIEKNHRHDEK